MLSKPLSRIEYCDKLTVAIDKDDQCAIEFLFNVSGGTSRIKELLSSKDLNPNRQGTQKGHALIHWATRVNNVDALEVLFTDPRTDSDIKNKNGCTALGFAVAQGKVAVTKALLDHNANPNIVNENGHVPLHCAIMGYFAMGTSYKDGYFKIITTLIENQRTSINELDSERKTPLHYAVIWKCRKIVVLLLSCKGIDLDIKDNNNKTVFDYAREDEKNNVIELLSSYKQKQSLLQK